MSPICDTKMPCKLQNRPPLEYPEYSDDPLYRTYYIISKILATLQVWFETETKRWLIQVYNFILKHILKLRIWIWIRGTYWFRIRVRMKSDLDPWFGSVPKCSGSAPCPISVHVLVEIEKNCKFRILSSPFSMLRVKILFLFKILQKVFFICFISNRFLPIVRRFTYAFFVDCNRYRNVHIMIFI